MMNLPPFVVSLSNHEAPDFGMDPGKCSMEEDAMAQYLIVAHQTATSPELLDRATELAGEDPMASFTILVPATPVVHLLTWEEGDTNEIASQKALEARTLFEGRGLNVAETKVGDGSLLLAIGDELRAQPNKY